MQNGQKNSAQNLSEKISIVFIWQIQFISSIQLAEQRALSRMNFDELT